MASKRDYYEILGVEKDAGAVEIKKSYKKLALANHPDRNPGDDGAVERFKEAAEAYEVLSDPDKRARYDRYGHAGVQGAAGRSGAQFHDIGDIFEQFGDIFEGFGFFGNRPRGGGAGPRRGSHLRSSLTITLVDAALGVEREVTVKRSKACSTCGGTGAEPGTVAEACDYCGGHGQVVQAQGFFRVQTTCPACRGAGHVIRNKCKTCGGTGREADTVTLDVKVPAGVDTGMQLCLRGEGEPGQNGGPRGDLFVDVRVEDHPLFQREGTHLMCRAPITYTQAVLGTTLEVPLIQGTDHLDIPAGTQPGEVFRLRGQGMPDPHGGRAGDLHVEIQLEVPKKLEPDHEELLRQLAEHEKKQVSPHQKSWFEKLKDLVTGEDDD
ncbi:MAG: molecular chaperone DnaJ [Planctomycetaceae bacterium]|nr:molecular chaperone DnaJ [Planctomycetaceae bacterium]